MALFSWGRKGKLESIFNAEIDKLTAQLEGLYEASGLSAAPDRTAQHFIAGWLVFNAYGNLRGFEAARKDLGWIHQKSMMAYVRDRTGERLGFEGIKRVEAMFLHVQEQLNTAFNVDKGASFALDPEGQWRSRYMVEAFVSLVFPAKGAKAVVKKLLDPMTVFFAVCLEQIKNSFRDV